jgi:broad specificity phosphatase PhoE
MNQRPALLLASLLFMGFAGVTHAQVEADMFTIYLARHAEKASAAEDPRDPPLSTCGELRAEALATMLKDVRLEKVYSTPYERTRSTALAVADSHHLETETYDPQNLVGFAGLLLERKQNSLVIGHSNSTAILAGLLAGEGGEEFGEEEYDRLYQVTLTTDERQMVLLHQAFSCNQQ